MRRINRIEPWDRMIAEGSPYNLEVASLGYESRARFIASELRATGKKRMAIGFGTQQTCAYEDNRNWFQRQGFGVNDVADQSFFAFCAETIRTLTFDEKETIRVRIDISSMSRYRIAALLAAFIESEAPQEFVLDFVYAPAEFIEPPHEMSQIESAGPVLPQFAGWSEEPDRPVATVFGVGFEYDRAIGVVEYLEPSEIWSFRPENRDTRFHEEVFRANSFFWRLVPASHQFTYRIDFPIDCLIDLESLTFGLLSHARPILIPFGPKLFALCCLLVAHLHFPRVGVWRVSSGTNEGPVDRKADGRIVGMCVQLTRNDIFP